ncbi:hypothetical protein [Sedimenticola hydrogenitrophicus]|uniref:hypothetical protein n=1 Tax=Sedimenticola hydrogenitrophicus TaxID=2967975 RepID=UPI0021A54629|nr:hypothetical protein [Sedimenticola hydrogenitrophicus]
MSSKKQQRELTALSIFDEFSRQETLLLTGAALALGMTGSVYGGEIPTHDNWERINSEYLCDYGSESLWGPVQTVAAEDALVEMPDIANSGAFSYSKELGVCRSRTNGTQLMGQLRYNGVPMNVGIAKIDEKMLGAYLKVGAAIGAVVLPAVLSGSSAGGSSGSSGGGNI